MARYVFKCVQEGCEKCDTEFTANFPMGDVGKTELYPRCECCGELTEKVWAPSGNFALKGRGWFAQGYTSGYTHDVRGNHLGNSIQVGGDWKD